jgi:CBS domain containing-hemolysin-like protein
VIVLPLIVILSLTALNTLYVAAEFAVVAVQRSQLVPLARDGNRRAAALLAVLEDGAARDRYIAACQIGITLSSVFAGAYAEAAIAAPFGTMLERVFAVEASAAYSGAALLVLVVLTALQVVIGELVPKSLALRMPDRVALATYTPMRWSIALYQGFIWLLNGSGFLLLKPFGVTPGGHLHVHSPQELELMFAESRRGGMLTPELHRRLQHGMRLSRRTVRHLMVPRSQIIAIEATLPHDEIVRRILASPFSRLPVYQGTIDQLLGSVSTRDIVGHYVATGVIPPLAQLLRPMPFVPENLAADRLIRVLRDERTSKAIVVDEFGGVKGIISVDDLFVELFGELGDELKVSDAPPELQAGGSVKLRGSMRADAAEPWLGEPIDSSAATLGGMIVDRLGRLPSVGETLAVGGAELTVLEVSRTAVIAVAVRSRVAEKGG